MLFFSCPLAVKNSVFFFCREREEAPKKPNKILKENVLIRLKRGKGSRTFLLHVYYGDKIACFCM